MAGDDNELQGLSTRMRTARRRGNTIKSTLDRIAQAIGRVSLKIDDRNLADGTNQSGHDRQSYQPPPHWPAPHHPPPRYFYNILNLVNFSMKRSCEVPSITTMILLIIIKMKGCSMEGDGGSLILTLIEGTNFRTLIGEIGFLTLFVTKEEDTQITMSLGSLLLMGILILSQLYFGLRKLISCFTRSIFQWKILQT